MFTCAAIQFFIPLFPPREGMARDLAKTQHQTQKDQAVSSLAPQCGQLQQSPIIYIQTRVALLRGLPTFTGTQPERDYISCQELETVQSSPVWLSTPEAPLPLLSIIPPANVLGCSSGSFLGSTWLFQICRSFSRKKTFD